ncbi:MAG: hypothetical protein LBI69_04465 [Puniceicoccales bacterium]|jgi:hypothetical protein|nr:hypothetical protein [Puniceicoccales bacterium]
MDKVKGLLGPYWEGYRSAWQSFYAKHPAKDKKKFPDNVPNDAFDLPEGCDEDIFRSKLLYIVDCFDWIFFRKFTDDENECVVFIQNFIAALATLNEKEFEMSLTIALNGNGATLVQPYVGETIRHRYRRRCDIFMQSMVKLNIETLLNCYLNLLLKSNSKVNWTRFARLCEHVYDPKLLEEILPIFSNGKHVQLAHLTKCAGSNTILHAVAGKHEEKNADAVCEKIWNFLCETLSKEDLKELCLTKEKNGQAAIVNFLYNQDNPVLKIKCIKLIGEMLRVDEKDQLLIDSQLLDSIYCMVSCVNDEGIKDKIINMIVAIFGNEKIIQYLQKKLALSVILQEHPYKMVKEKDEKRKINEFKAFLSRKFKINVDNIEICTRIFRGKHIGGFYDNDDD